ncbi:complex I subunit 5 family protein [Thiolapillus sp.]|uniref:complex I subunit 5 family protein n=1 Tax=Thiolapillus sp. TaxID=2017437 RepID=UPI003AF41391
MNAVALLVVLPLLAAFLTPSLGRVSGLAAKLLGPAVLLFCLGLVWHYSSGDGLPFSIALGGFLPPLGINLYVDSLALLFAGIVFLLVLLAWPWGDGSREQYALLMLLAGSSAALALSGDLFNIFVFYELGAVASFGLVVSAGTRAAHLATFRYLLISGLGSVLFLLSVAIVYINTGTLNLAHLATLAPQSLNNIQGLVAFVLILLGVGVKAELFLVNSWVPEVYATAPGWISGLLAGMVSKLAILVLLRLLILVFDFPDAHNLLLLLGVAGFVSGELAAWWARDFRRMLAFSSIGQLGLVFIGFSISGQAGVMAGLAVALHHVLVKPALFYLAESWGGALARLRGAGGRSPLAAAVFILFALSLIGVPPLPGFWAKMLVIMGLAGEGGNLQITAIAAVLVVTVVEAAYLLRLVGSFYAGDGPEAVPSKQGPWDISRALLFAVGLLLAMVFVLPLGDWLSSVSGEAMNVPHYVAVVLQRGELQ